MNFNPEARHLLISDGHEFSPVALGGSDRPHAGYESHQYLVTSFMTHWYLFTDSNECSLITVQLYYHTQILFLSEHVAIISLTSTVFR